jgi:hypothetical protein
MPSIWSCFTWSQVFITANASSVVTTHATMPLPRLRVPNPFLKHMIYKRRYGPNLPCQMSYLRCPSL